MHGSWVASSYGRG